MIGQGLDKISSAKVAELTKQNGKQIGSWFGAFGLKPGTYDFTNAPDAAKTDGQKASKGYKMNSAMAEAFDRFLPALPAQVK
jgi:hypothetical protein